MQALHAGAGVADITAPKGTDLGGYWGRAGPAAGTPLDPLTARVLILRQRGEGGGDGGGGSMTIGTGSTVIVSLDLVGVDCATAGRLKSAVLATAEAPAHHVTSSESILLCCTHTHTGPQTHAGFVGMGHCGEAYLAALCHAVVVAFRQAVVRLTPVKDIVHARSRAINGVAVNRRQRVGERIAKEDGANPNARWFEIAGKTTLGQRPDGPRVPAADVLHVRRWPDAAIVATLVAFACHPTCIGPGLEQSADYCGVVRNAVADAVGETATVFYLNGACGDVNPVLHRGGFSAAVATGTAIAKGTMDANTQSEVSAEDVLLINKLSILALPTEPIPSARKAQSFLDQQRAWLQEEEAAAATGRAATVTTSGRLGVPCARACCDYARDVLKLAESSTSSQADTTRAFRVHVCLIGPVALVGMEGEIFSGYALDLARTAIALKRVGGVSVTPIVVGYANGCIGYVPTESEFPWGGYEVCNAYRVYGQANNLDPTAERIILSSANAMLSDVVGEAVSLRQNLASKAENSSAERAPEGEERESAVLRRGEKAKKNRPKALLAKAYDSCFPDAHDTYNSIGADKSGRFVYYVLSSERIDVGARLYRLDTNAAAADAAIEDLGDLTEDACRDARGHVCQGKSHVPLVDCCDHGFGIVFGTHVGFYSFRDGMETISVEGDPELRRDPDSDSLKPYPGGCVISWMPSTRSWVRHGRVPRGEGVLTMAVDAARGRAFYLTWPSGKFGVCTLSRRDDDGDAGAASRGGTEGWPLQDYPGRGKGETVHPRFGEYRCCCRSMVVDPRTGNCYWSNADGDVLEWSQAAASGGGASIRVFLQGKRGGLCRDYFGEYSSADPGHMAYHWRSVQWVGEKNSIVGVHGNSGYLFRLRVIVGKDGTSTIPSRVEVLERICSLPSKRLGNHDFFSYGYLGFTCRKDRATGRMLVHYLTGAPIFEEGNERALPVAKRTKKGESRGVERLHYVTFDLDALDEEDYAESGGGTNPYFDHGPVFFVNRAGFPTYVNSIALGGGALGDGAVFALGRMENGLSDLFRFERTSVEVPNVKCIAVRGS